MKTIVRILSVLCLILLFTSALAIASFALGEPSVRVIDLAGILSASEKEELELAAQEAEVASGHLHRVFISDDEDGFYDSRILSELDLSYTDSVTIIFVEREDGVLYYELITYGNANEEISEAESGRILDDDTVYTNIKGGNVATGVKRALSLSTVALSGALRKSFIEAFVPALIVGLVVALIFAAVIIVSYKRKLKSASYPLERYTNMRLNVSHDTFLGKFVTRVKIRSNSSASGRSGGGGGGSRGRR